MELSDSDKFEVQAETFRIMTGHIHPGKDASPATYPAPPQERAIAYAKWYADNCVCVRAMFLALRRVLSTDE